ncbi:MAG TPA: peptidoglycan editing factor PgeF [Polyangia bacterium]
MAKLESDGVTAPLLRSPVLTGFAHGFSTREGGVSPPPFHSLNTGARWGDTRDNVLENRRRIQRTVGADRLFFARQVHGAAVARFAADSGEDVQPEADALITNVAAVGVFTADCVPLLMADPRSGAVAAVHAGWRGVIAGVAPAALRALTADFGSRPDEMRVALGPAIGACCFEVGDEVVATFAENFSRSDDLVTQGARGRPHIDLRRALSHQLSAAGVRPENLDLGGPCTMCDPARFYSYRRDNTQTGQHLSVIVSRAPVVTV